jgi:hypothetical protein
MGCRNWSGIPRIHSMNHPQLLKSALACAATLGMAAGASVAMAQSPMPIRRPRVRRREVEARLDVGWRGAPDVVAATGNFASDMAISPPRAVMRKERRGRRCGGSPSLRSRERAESTRCGRRRSKAGCWRVRPARAPTPTSTRRLDGRGRSPDFGLTTLAYWTPLPKLDGSVRWRRSFPFTAAGQSRICTGFPFEYQMQCWLPSTRTRHAASCDASTPAVGARSSRDPRSVDIAASSV